MARYCPVKDGPALYLDCLECDERECEQEKIRKEEKKKEKEEC